MRNVDSHLLEDKMDEAVTHYINSHQTGEPVHVDTNALALNVQDDGGRLVTVMHGQGYSSHLSRQISVGEHVGEGPWSEELLDPEGKLAALVAHLAQQSRASHHHHATTHKVSSGRSDVDPSVILDTPLRLFNGHNLESQPSEPIVSQVAPLPPLPPLQEMKRCQDTDWFHNKHKTTLKDDEPLLSGAETPGLGAGASPAQTKHNKKSLPHKKRISRKLRRNNGSCTPQDIVVINCNEEVVQEEILPDNFVTSGMPHPGHIHPADTAHHITHEVRPILICQLCGEFYGEEQLKFYQHLKQHYEPHATIIIENPVADLGIDKMTNTCIVDNATTLPDSIVELSLESTDHVPKTMYQHMDKHPLYSTSDKTLYSNKVQYSMSSIDKDAAPSESEKTDLYDSLDKLELYSCMKCNKSFRKQKQCELHIKEAHSTSKLEDMGEFSEPEDLMEGIHVAVEETAESFEQSPLPHLTVENGHVHQEHVRLWYMRNGHNAGDPPLPPCGTDGAFCPVCPATREQTTSPQQLKEEVLQRIFDTEVPSDQNFTDNIMSEAEMPPEHNKPTDDKKKTKRFECPQCGRVFHHRNSLLYHLLSHSGKQQVCRDCGKGFYTANALKVHRRVHNGDRPYKCEDCGREFRQWSDLKYHRVSIHSNQKNFKCDYCGKDFARKYSLNVHRRIHTGERNYKCEYCNKTFRASSYRTSHMRTHTGDRPYQCSVCEKCFRVAGDLRRHMITHEKMKTRFEELRKQKEDKAKKPTQKDDKIQPKKEVESEVAEKVKKIALASTARPALLKKEEKKSKAAKKTKKVGAPNVTIQNRCEFKLGEYTNNVEVFDTRQVDYKFKEVYTDVQYSKEEHYKVKAYGDQIVYKDCEQRLEEKELATLRPIFRSNLVEEAEKPVYNRAENTDGKMQVFTHIEKSKEYGVASGAMSLNDIRTLERERGETLHGETIENGFLERLTALYNIPA